ncbi:MAG: glutathione S-transferase N-terminal domain-containing protein [Solirubrobacteraceae bacterium]|nr:glutathione S-transferase N-terminal domain-containing protein [Solirubrobacteraceae bacterium]
MKLYTCGQGRSGSGLHPCKKAVNALDGAGYEYEQVKVAGYRALPWTRGGGARDEVRELSGQPNVPILVLDDGSVISGSGTIAKWAKEHPAA